MEKPKSNSEPRREYNRWEYLLICLSETWVLSGTIFYYVLGIASCMVWLDKYQAYDRCIAIEKANKIISSKDPDDVSDNLEWHLYGSAICCFALVLTYGMWIFQAPNFLKLYHGVIYCVTLFLAFVFNWVSIVWFAQNDWDKTTVYTMAIINNVTMLVLIIASTIVIFIFFLKVVCTNRDKANLKVSNQETQDKDKPKPSTADISNGNNLNDNIQAETFKLYIFYHKLNIILP